MNQWFNGSHPQTLQAGVILGYISAVFGLLAGFLFPLFIGLGAGAFVTANNKRWGYYLLAICATAVAFFRVLNLVNIVARSFSLVPFLFAVNALIFPIALAAAVLHNNSRQYQRIWFE